MSGVLELSIRRQGTWPVDGSGTAVHRDRHADQFGDFGLGCAGACGTFCVRRNATVAMCGDGNCQCHKFLCFCVERTCLEGCGVQTTETLVDVGDQFAKITGERRQISLNFFAVRVHVFVGFVVRHDLSQPQRMDSFYGRNVLVLILNLAATMFMVGLIWFVQIVHYPLLAVVGMDRAIDVAVEHQRRTSWVVGFPMALEGVSTLWLMFDTPDGVNRLVPWVTGAILGIVLLSTVFLSVPLHARMAENPEPSIGRRLVTTNWPRTIGWSTRGVLVAVMLWQATR